MLSIRFIYERNLVEAKLQRYASEDHFFEERSQKLYFDIRKHQCANLMIHKARATKNTWRKWIRLHPLEIMALPGKSLTKLIRQKELLP